MSCNPCYPFRKWTYLNCAIPIWHPVISAHISVISNIQLIKYKYTFKIIEIYIYINLHLYVYMCIYIYIYMHIIFYIWMFPSSPFTQTLGTLEELVFSVSSLLTQSLPQKKKLVSMDWFKGKLTGKPSTYWCRFVFPVWCTFPCYLLHFGTKTCTLLNFGANICHLHCSPIVEAQPCWVQVMALDAIIVLVGLGFI